MKIINIILIGVITFYSSCSNCTCSPENTLAMNDTTFNDKFECLDLSYLLKEGNPRISTPTGPFDYYFDEYYFNSATNKIYIQGDYELGYTHYISIDTSNYISIHKSYYPDGKIKIKGIYNDLGFEIGKWYKFNSSGSLAETIDMEKGFDFTFEQLKEKLIREEKLSFSNLPARNPGNWGNEYPINISRFSEPDPRWYVRYSDPENSADGARGTSVEIIYDGKTGEKISKSFIPIM